MAAQKAPAREPTQGRPSKINKPATTTNGQLTTTADAIVDRLRAGAYFEHACASVGVHKDTAYGWLKTAAQTRTAILEGTTTRTKLTAHQQRCLSFSDAVDEAQAAWVVRQEAELERIARGGHTIQVITEKVDGRGKVIERTTRTEVTAPDPRVIQWRLERKHPDLYGRRTVNVNLGGQEGNPVRVEAEVSPESLLSKLQAVKGAAS